MTYYIQLQSNHHCPIFMYAIMYMDIQECIRALHNAHHYYQQLLTSCCYTVYSHSHTFIVCLSSECHYHQLVKGPLCTPLHVFPFVVYCHLFQKF